MTNSQSWVNSDLSSKKFFLAILGGGVGRDMQNQQHRNIVNADIAFFFFLNLSWNIESDKALFLVGIILAHIAFFFLPFKNTAVTCSTTFPCFWLISRRKTYCYFKPGIFFCQNFEVTNRSKIPFPPFPQHGLQQDSQKCDFRLARPVWKGAEIPLFPSTLTT